MEDIIKDVCVYIVVALLILGVIHTGIDINFNRHCQKLGYATEKYIYGTSYCVAFEDGVMKDIAILRAEDGEYFTTQKFMLIEGGK